MNRPTLVVLGGFAGAGKTTVARRLSHELNLPIFSSDLINDGLRLALNMDFHTASPPSYDLLWFLLKTHLKIGASAIVDTNMCRSKSWDNLDRLNSEMPEVRLLPIILKCSLEVHRQRIEYRGQAEPEHFNLGGDRLEDVMFKYRFIEGLKRDDLITVDANRDAETVYQAVKKLVAKV